MRGQPNLRELKYTYSHNRYTNWTQIHAGREKYKYTQAEREIPIEHKYTQAEKAIPIEHKYTQAENTNWTLLHAGRKLGKSIEEKWMQAKIEIPSDTTTCKQR